ncbi:MAG: hypothetical protein A2007_05230 [Verrucomicrobia bacterium GWC2_42_7]|nr:MAG: hypothetical protein A2007_05230 [Verrucomicrobia bacterium GWC2_42_7]
MDKKNVSSKFREGGQGEHDRAHIRTKHICVIISSYRTCYNARYLLFGRGCGETLLGDQKQFPRSFWNSPLSFPEKPFPKKKSQTLTP